MLVNDTQCIKNANKFNIILKRYQLKQLKLGILNAFSSEVQYSRMWHYRLVLYHVYIFILCTQEKWFVTGDIKAFKCVRMCLPEHRNQTTRNDVTSRLHTLWKSTSTVSHLRGYFLNILKASVPSLRNSWWRRWAGRSVRSPLMRSSSVLPLRALVTKSLSLLAHPLIVVWPFNQDVN